MQLLMNSPISGNTFFTSKERTSSLQWTKCQRVHYLEVSVTVHVYVCTYIREGGTEVRVEED